ncbi:MAG: DUF433 domain-containing protein [Dehalococcoidia bacterium]
MTLEIAPAPVPLTIDSHGVVKVTGSRVTLDTIVSVFNDGAGAEEIVLRYTTLYLADVYSILGYYLHHRAEVDVYLEEQHLEAAAVRRENEARFPPDGVRERLLARQSNSLARTV